MARDFQIILQGQCGSGLQSVSKLRDLSIIIIIILGILVWAVLADLSLGTAPGTILRNSESKSLFKEFNLPIKFLEELIILFSPKLSPRI